MMIKGLFKNSGISMKFMQLIFAFIFILIFILPIIKLLTNNNFEDIDNLKIAQLIQSVGMFVVIPFVLAFLWSEKPFQYLQLSTSKLKWSSILLVFVFMVAAIPFINLTASLNQQIVLPEFLAPLETLMKAYEEQIADLTGKLLDVRTIDGLLFNVLLIAILPALGEELFFRGILQKIFTEWRGMIFGIWVAAFVFSAIHMQFYGFFPRMLLGAFFGYLLMWSGSLWLPIIAHFTNNVVAVIFYYLKYNGVTVIDIDVVGTGETLWIGIVSGIVAIGGLFLIKKNLENDKKAL